MKEILRLLKPEMDIQETEETLEQLFGYVHGEKAHRSNIVISESVIEGARKLTSTRTAISRFENSAKKNQRKVEVCIQKECMWTERWFYEWNYLEQQLKNGRLDFFCWH